VRLLNPINPCKKRCPFEIAALILVFFGGILMSFIYLGLGLTADDSITPFLPFFLALLVGACLFGGILKSLPVLLLGVFLVGYAPLQILLGIGLIHEGHSLAPWVILHFAVLLVASLGTWSGRVIAQSAGRRLRKSSIQ
jgi:hypothetical protein